MSVALKAEELAPDASRASDARRMAIWGAMLALLLTTFALAPLTHPGFFEANTGFLPSFNVQHLSAAPNWGRSPDWLRGEGILPYLVAWPLFALSGDGVVAVKWGYGLAFALSALGMYAWTRRWLGVQGGVLAATVYTYLPWHLGTVYTRGAYAEAWLWALWPAVLWAVDGLAGPHRLTSILATLIGAAAGFWIQPGLTVLFLALVCVYAWVRLASRRRLAWGSAGVVLLVGLLVGLARLAPRASQAFSSELLYPYQLLAQAGASADDAAWSGLSFQLGVAAVGLSIVTVALWLEKRVASDPRDHGLDRGLGFCLASALLVVLLTLRPLAFIWRLAGLGSLLTHPWQMLALAGPGLAFAAGAAVRTDRRLAELSVWAGLVALVVLASYSYLAPRFTQVDPGAEPVAAFQPLQASEPEIYLLDARVATSSEITPTLTVTLTWQTVARLDKDYTVFVHLLAGDGTRIGQQDSPPCSGDCPTSGWQEGEIVVDRHQVTRPRNAPSGPYRLSLGLYVLDSGERVPVVGRDDGTVLLDVP